MRAPRRLAGFAVALLASLAVAAPALAQDYPSRPIRLIVTFGAGGNADLVARVIAQPLAAAVGQPIVIENRPGAGGTLGASVAAQAAPDGYTLLFSATGPNAVAPSIYAKLTYDPARSFAAIGRLSVQPSVIAANPGLGARDLASLIALAKASPGKLNFGSPGVGTTAHLAGELFKTLAGVDLVHVPYKEGSQALTDLVEGRISLMFDNVGQFLPYFPSGKLNALAVAAPQRTRLLPDLPTAAEAGLPGYAYAIWFGLSAPAQTPAAITTLLSRHVTTVLAQPDVVTNLARLNAEPGAMAADEFQAYIASEIAKWAKVAQAAGIKPE
jgi:tripartite-type tricarboxylate transporter receptor subunit TctC